MKKILAIILCLIFMKNVFGNEILNQAKELAKADPDKAIELLKENEKENKQNPDYLSYHGVLLSQQAGRVSFMKAGYLTRKAYQKFAAAIALDSDHIDTLLNRGITSYYVPKFLGKSKIGIADLEHILKIRNLSNEVYIVAEFYLGLSYLKQDDAEKGKKHLKNVVRYGNKTQYYEQAKEQLLKISTNEPEAKGDYQSLLKEAYNAQENGELNLAYQKFAAAFEINKSDNAMLLNFAGMLGEIAGKGYTDEVNTNTNFMADLAQDVHKIVSQAVSNSPNSFDLRLLRSSIAVSLPFFVDTEDDIKNDLNWFKENGKLTNEDVINIEKQFINKIKTQELADKYEDADKDKKSEILSEMIKKNYSQEQPANEALKVELLLGYRDFIAPQTAIWIENEQGEYISTIYVSGFSGKAKEKQVHLETWANQSKFNNIDTVTSASIDAGKNIFFWDFTDNFGNEISDSKIKICVEVAHWPHPEYSIKKFDYDLTKFPKKNYFGDDIIQSVRLSKTN